MEVEIFQYIRDKKKTIPILLCYWLPKRPIGLFLEGNFVSDMKNGYCIENQLFR